MTQESDGHVFARRPASAAASPMPGAAVRAIPDVAGAGVPAGADNIARLLAGPSGLGTSGCRLPSAPRRDTSAPSEDVYASCTSAGPGADAPTEIIRAREATGIGLRAVYRSDLVRRDIYAPLPYREREWGDGSCPALYCPDTVRIDDDLADEVNRRLVSWAERVGIYATQIDKFRDTGFGRLAMLVHPDSDDPDMLLVAAQMNAAWWAADDYYADETPLGATPTELPPRLALVMSAMDPPPSAGDYTRQLGEALQADPVLVALTSATAHLSRHATPSQVMRACNTTFQMHVSWTAYAAWRYLETAPPCGATSQHDSTTASTHP